MRGKEYIEETTDPSLGNIELSENPFRNFENKEHFRINLERVLKPIPNVTPRHIDILRRYHGIGCEPEKVEEIRKTAGINGESVSKQKIYQILESAIHYLKKYHGRDNTKSYMVNSN